MKILEIKFSNIHNLKDGPHLVSFDQPPLSNAGLFAILGPTGSGKSTLLDVITLALFNQIPRFKQKISKKHLAELGSVMTYHADSAEAHVKYEVGSRMYTSSWRISRARTGNLRDYEMSISDEAGNYLDLKKSEVPAHNEKLIGLSYDQFVKSIILSQGQFSRFLSADKNERGQLLEDITGSHIYRSIGQRTFQRHKELQTRLEIEKEKIEGLTRLSEEELKAIQKSIKMLGLELLELDKTMAQLTKNIDAKQKKIELEKLIENHSLALRHAVQNIEAFKSSLNRIRVHDQLIPYLDDLTRHQEAKARLTVIQSEITGSQSKEVRLNELLNQTISKMSELTGKMVDQENFKPVMSAFEKEINELDYQLNQLVEQGKELRGQISVTAKRNQLNFNEQIEPQAAIDHLQKEMNLMEEQITRSELNQFDDLKLIRSRLERDRDYLQVLQEYSSHIKHLAKLHTEKETLNTKIQELKNEIAGLKPLLVKSEQLIEVLVKTSRLLAKRKEDAIRIATYEEQRQDLTDGEPCPLCGSTSHPYTSHLIQEDQRSIDQEMEDNLKVIDSERQHRETLQHQIIQSQTSLEETVQLVQKTEVEIINLQKNIQFIEKDYSQIKQIESSRLDDTIENQKTKIKQLEVGMEAINQLRGHREIIEIYQSLALKLDDYKKVQTLRQSKFTGRDVSQVCNDLQDTFTRSQTDLALITQSRQLLLTETERLTKLLLDLNEKLTPHLRSHGLKTIDEMSRHILKPEELQTLRDQHASLIQQKTRSETELKGMNDQLVEQSKLDEQPETDLDLLQKRFSELKAQRDEKSISIGEFKAQLSQDEEIKSKQKAQQKIVDKLQSELDIWSRLNQMIGDKTGNKFSNFAQGLTLQNLLVLANHRLRKLTDRYLLDQPKNEHELSVVDLYQGHITRGVTTLSGGETFLMSLALALSLSDMASKNVSLDSLFIDEGFGTLDQETLDVALDTLERLQIESQKTVGVISHVEALKERISVQIRLEKDARGYSQIKVLS